MTATGSTRKRRQCVSTTMLLWTFVCMLLGTNHALRGVTVQHPPRSAPRMLMMETPMPTSSPSERPPPSPSPSALVQEPVFLQLPTATPSEEPTANDTPKPSTPPNLPITDSTTSLPTTPPSSAPETPVTIADFRIQYVSLSQENPENEEYGMQAVTQEYLLQRMQLDYNTLKRIELLVNPRRNLQTSTPSSQIYSGTAYFDSQQPVPSVPQVQYSQTVALEDTEALQMSFEMAGLSVQVQQVEVAPLPEEPAPNTNATNAGMIAGVTIGAVIIVGLLAFVGYKWYSTRKCNCLNVIDLDKDISRDHDKDDFVKYTPDDFEPVQTSQMDNSVDRHPETSVDVSSVDMDEYSLSAASADSSVKHPEQRRESLLKKLALYQKTERKPHSNGGNVPMPAALFVPQVVGNVNDEEDSVASSAVFSSPKAPNSPMVVMDSPERVTEQSRAVSLLDQSGMTNDDSTDDEYDEEDLLPPPVPLSTSRSPEWALEGSPGQELVPSTHGMQSQWSFSPMQQAGEENVETQIVPSTHDFPSTTWVHPMALVTSGSYSDGPSDEMNAVLEQDLANFEQLAIVSPATDKTPIRSGRSVAPPSPERGPPPPPAGPPPQQSRARSTERRPSGKPPRAYGQQVIAPVTPPRRQRASSSRSRSGLELKEVEPPPNAHRRPRSSSSRRRSSEDERSHSDASYDGSYASNRSEVIEDLNTLSDFLRERREAKRAQRRERTQERSSRSRRR